jgi:hypothetical protein
MAAAAPPAIAPASPVEIEDSAEVAAGAVAEGSSPLAVTVTWPEGGEAADVADCSPLVFVLVDATTPTPA